MRLEHLKTRTASYGIYLHIPFCKQACHYCNYHFSTTLKKKGKLVDALCQELLLRKDELEGIVETIYFGGGTPSLLSKKELTQIFDTIYSNYSVSKNPEITLEANPDDLVSVRESTESSTAQKETKTTFEDYKEAGINRLSIGVQSFFETDLQWMNRAHNAAEAMECILEAKKYFKNITIDLIYGIPNMSVERWQKNLETAFSLQIPHLSCYALTVEPKTALEKFIEIGKSPPVEDDLSQEHHEILIAMTEQAGYDNYEFSNFGKPGYYSQNNMAYWTGKPYLGIGPSAHSFDRTSRSWNVSNNIKYIKSIGAGVLPSEREMLSEKDHYNEYVMTRLRTKEGISLKKVETDFGASFLEYMMNQAKPALENENLLLKDQFMVVSKKGKFLSDGLAGDLFWV